MYPRGFAQKALTFQAFGPQHLAALLVITAFSLGLGALARRMSPTGRRRVGQALGSAIVLNTALLYALLARGGAFSLATSLPLYLCDVAEFLCVICLWLAPYPLLVDLVYFWGLGGATQALATPDIAHGFPSAEFFMFFAGHGLVMATVAFLTLGCGVLPSARGSWNAMVGLNVYVLLVGLLDWCTGWNYGYLCHPPSRASVVDYLGPWPWYLLSVEVLATLVFLALGLPWRYRCNRNRFVTRE